MRGIAVKTSTVPRGRLPEHAAKLFAEVQPSKNSQPCSVFDRAQKRLQRIANKADDDRDHPPPDGAPGSL